MPVRRKKIFCPTLIFSGQKDYIGLPSYNIFKLHDPGNGREWPRYAIEEMSEMRLMVINRAGGVE
jgi:hypothetical protein